MAPSTVKQLRANILDALLHVRGVVWFVFLFFFTLILSYLSEHERPLVRLARALRKEGQRGHQRFGGLV